MLLHLCNRCGNILPEEYSNPDDLCEECRVSATGQGQFICDRCQSPVPVAKLREGEATLVVRDTGPAMLLCKKCSIVSRARLRARQDLRYLLLCFAVCLLIPLSAGIAGYFARSSPVSLDRDKTTQALKQELAEVKEIVRGLGTQIAKHGMEARQVAAPEAKIPVADRAERVTGSRSSESEITDTRGSSTTDTRGPSLPEDLYLEKLVASISQAAVSPGARKLETGNTQARLEAILEIVRTRDEAGVPVLESALNDEDPLVRSLSAKALASLGSQPSVGKLMTALGDPELFVRNSVAGALSNLTGETFLFYEDIPLEKWEKLHKIKEQQK